MKYIKDFDGFLKESSEFLEDLKFRKSVDEDGVEIKAKDEYGDIAGRVCFTYSENYYSYFQNDFTEEEYYDFFPNDSFVNITHLEVDEYYQGEGLAKQLMKRVIKLAKKEGYDRIFLNASPVGYTGLELEPLVKFYKKFGFEEIKNQGKNVLMLLRI